VFFFFKAPKYFAREFVWKLFKTHFLQNEF
jgi:hypothetical protein